MTYKAITPADGWYFVTLPDEPQKPTIIVWPVAVWAINSDDEVVGLVSVPGGGPDDTTMGSTCRLVGPPPNRGVYKHSEELTADEISAIRSASKIGAK